MPSQTKSPTPRPRDRKLTTRLLPDSVKDEINSLLQRLAGYSIGKFFWNELLTEAERRQLGGDLDVALRKEHIVDIWARLRGQSQLRAVVELSYHTELVMPKKYEQLLRKIGVAKPRRTSAKKPVWDQVRCELLVDGEVIRKFPGRGRSKNVMGILDAFQELGWPEFIDDPLPGGKNGLRLNQAIFELNQDQNVIKFQSNGSGNGIQWHFTSPN